MIKMVTWRRDAQLYLNGGAVSVPKITRLQVEISMRELKLPEVKRVAGGANRMDTVVVTGTRVRRDPWTQQGQSIGDYYNFSGGLDLTNIQFGGGGAPSAYDPSPEDGIVGLNVQDDGITLTWTAETSGFFDLNGDGQPGPGEPVVDRGATNSLEINDSTAYNDAIATLSTFTPITSGGQV